jgi:hypothetical protein
VIADRATLDVTRELAQFVAKQLLAERRRRGGNIQAVCALDGFPLWLSPAEPRWVHGLTATRAHAFTARYRAAALQHVTASPSKIGVVAHAALVLTHFEHGYITRISLRSLHCA